LPEAYSIAFTGAIAVGWTVYEIVHQWIHVHGPKGRYGRWAARYHLSHHFAKPWRNHGVTTPIWDVILRTRDRPGVVRVPRKQLASVPWLEEALRSDDPPAFTTDYRVA
jgi:sterol desaturase/sphingolipid hydroxylase (fatty acid hydroxylase superfamily)